MLIMNFRFTKTKTLVSVIVSAVIGLYFLITERGIIILDAPTPLSYIIMSKLIIFISSFVLSFVPIYVVWSLFEKKGEKSSLNIVGFIIGALILLLIILFFVL